MFLTDKEIRARRWRKLGELFAGSAIIAAGVTAFYLALLWSV